jgi:PAS domain S-box-containing protein
VTKSSNPPKRDLERLILGTSEESFRLIVETIPGLIAVMTPEGQVEHVNRQVLEYFGRTLEDLKQWGTTDAVHPADLPEAIAAWQHAVETGLPSDFEHRIRRADTGELRWLAPYGRIHCSGKGPHRSLVQPADRHSCTQAIRREAAAERSRFARSAEAEPRRQLATRSGVGNIHRLSGGASHTRRRVGGASVDDRPDVQRDSS